MTTVEAETMDEFDLDIQIDETNKNDLPHRNKDHSAITGTLSCSCTLCCLTALCTLGCR